MKSIGGQYKSLDIFFKIKDSFEYDNDYRIYIASKDNKIVSALLIFYFKDSVEYFTPATDQMYRGQQPLTALIYTSMLDSIIDKKSRIWNWGGTGINHENLYRFKNRFGAKDYIYNYHVKLFQSKDKYKSLKSDKILRDYKYFYVIPFTSIQ